MKTLITLSLGLLMPIVASLQVQGAETAAPPLKIVSLEVAVQSGVNQKELHSHLYLLISRRRPEPGATEGHFELLRTKGYDYSPNDKWGPNEEKTFGPLVSVERFNKDDLGGLTLLNAMDAPNAADFQMAWIKVLAIDLTGKKWLIAKYIHMAGLWLRSKPDANELPALPIPTAWGEQPTGQ